MIYFKLWVLEINKVNPCAHVVANLVSKRDPKIAIFRNGFPSFVNGFLLSSMAFWFFSMPFCFLQWLSAFLNGFLIFLNAFLLSATAFQFPQRPSASKLFISWIIYSISKLFISWIIFLQCLHLTQHTPVVHLCSQLCTKPKLKYNLSQN